MKCCMPFCKQSRENLVSDTCSKMGKVTFHKLPPILRNVWLEYISLNESKLPDDAVVCSQHFQKDDFHVTKCGSIKLKNNAIPSVFRHNLRNSKSSAVQVCMICLDTASKLCPFNEYLVKAYSNVTGLSKSLFSDINIEPKLCTGCVKKLTHCNKLRDMCLSSHNLLLQVYKKYGMLTLENITNRAQLKSNKEKESDHCAFHFKDNLEGAQSLHRQSTHKFVQYAELKDEINGDLMIDPKVKKETSDFDADYEADSDVDDSFRDAETLNKFNKDNSNTDVKCLNEDIDHDMDFIDEYDNCVSIFNDNILKEDEIKKNINLITFNNKKSKATKYEDVVDSKSTFNKTKEKPKILNGRKDIKLIKPRPLLRKLSKSDKKLSPGDIKNMENVAKPKTDCGELKLFTVNVLSYEKQLSEVQKRKETVSYRSSPYKCTICFKGYWFINPYNRHMEKHTNKYGQLVCAVCGFHMKTRRKLVTHIRKNHDVRFSCMNCPFTTNNKSQAQAHEQWHNGRKFCCPHCEAEFTKRSSCLSHVRIKHPSDCVCALCGFSFVSEKGLQCHISMTHNFEETQNPSGPLCEECDIRFASVTAYEQHMKVSPRHNAEKTLFCHCTLKRNEPQRNTKRRPLYPKSKKEGDNDTGVAILCELCGKSFKWPVHLRQHMSVHTGEKRFKCDICDKRFMHKLSLTLHSECHSANPARYECGVCGKNFTNNSNRQRHMALHQGTRPHFKCDVCDKQFATAQSRNSHVSHVHSNVPWPKRVRSSRPKAPGHVRRTADTSDSQDS